MMGAMSEPANPKRRTSARNAAPVEVRSMSTPKPGWTLEEAIDLLEAGYTPEQVERQTGFDSRHVAAQLQRRQKAQRPATPQVRPAIG
jgi:hypothetical protein